ncbi:MAG: hypothetical protein ACFUZC_19465 [Chthoniobacteraceae bacterium]
MMKRSIAAAMLAIATTLCGLPGAQAQDAQASIKVTTRLNANGTRTDTQKNLEERISDARTTDKNGKLISHVVFRLDEMGRETEGTVYNAKDQVVSMTSLRYDGMGQIIEQVEKSATGAVTRRTVFIRDAQGRLTSIESYDGQGKKIQMDNPPVITPRVKTKK